MAGETSEREKMPELPDVERFKDYFDSTSLKKRIEKASALDDFLLKGVSPATLKKRLEGRRFEKTRRWGKYLFARADSGGWLVLHFGMTGSLDYYSSGQEQPRFTRLRLDFEDGGHLAYVNQRRLGRVGWTHDPEAFARRERLGPDAMSGNLSLEEFKELLSVRGRAIKPVLMDQSIISGIGNLYADEILFQARIDPRTPARELDDEAVGRLYRAMRKVLAVAARTEIEHRPLPRAFLMPHRKEGDKCPGCAGPVQRTKIAGRSTYFCPGCQRRKAA